MLTYNSKFKNQNHSSKFNNDLRSRTYEFSLGIIKFINDFPQKRVYWVISDQLLRASLSIGANIIEARASSSKKDFTNYFQISLKSANETEYWLCLLRDSGLVDTQKVEGFIDEVKQISKMLGASILTMKGKKL